MFQKQIKDLKEMSKTAITIYIRGPEFTINRSENVVDQVRVEEIEEERRTLGRMFEQIRGRATSRPIRSQTTEIGRKILKQTTKVKRGLASYVNGVRLSAIADTGAEQNVILARYATEQNLLMDHSVTETFKLGNSKTVESIGTVNIDYAFALEPSNIFKLTCHVISDGIYDLILGSPFLAVTGTMSKYRHRLTECVFQGYNLFHHGYLGNNSQRLKGCLADYHPALAVPDSGAECNVIDQQYVFSYIPIIT